MSDTTAETRSVPYDALAPFYDALTAHHDHELWVGALIAAARAAGLRGDQVLDVGCGTGKSSAPFIRRGYNVTGLDLSGEMLRTAAHRTPGARLVQGDMRALPRLGNFDLVVCLNDGVNYLRDADELASALAGMRRNLRPGGLVLFDANTLHAYREHFSGASVVRSDGELVLLWHGRTPHDLPPGGHASLVIEAFSSVGDRWERHSSRHTQRHHPDDEVRDALEAAGLRLADTAGHGFDAVLERPAEPMRHNKLIYIARRPGLPAPDHKEVKEPCCPSCTPASRWPPRHPSSREAEAPPVRAARAARTTPPALA